ncbi:MAG: hypothetical protein RR623_08185 [Bacilli bacterium]
MENEKEYGFFVNGELLLEGAYTEVDKEFMKTIRMYSKTYGSDMDVYKKIHETDKTIIHELILIGEDKLTNKQVSFELRIIEKQYPLESEEEN